MCGIIARLALDQLEGEGRQPFPCSDRKVRCWPISALQSPAQHDRSAAQSGHGTSFSTAAGQRADLPWAGADRQVVCRLLRLTCLAPDMLE
jgi:hypothetical protein